MNDLSAPWSIATDDPADRDASAAANRSLERIAEVETEVQAFAPEPDRASRVTNAAEALTRRWPDPADRPALYGVPVAVKDVIHVDGLTTRAGTEVPAEELQGAQAAVVDRLHAAGALTAGKANTAEFAISAPGPTRNPRRTSHTPGGSSSGSAAAVAAGMTPLAVGTQTVSSTVRPAAYCGVVGFKPTQGRISVDGIIPNSPSMDTVGLFGADVGSVRLAATAVCDDWRPVPEAKPNPVLGLPIGPYLDQAEPEGRQGFHAALAPLIEAGWTVRKVPVLRDLRAVRMLLYMVQSYELPRVHADWYARHPKAYRERTRQAVTRGKDISESDYRTALRSREAFRRALASLMERTGVDAWVCPGAVGPAPRGLRNPGSPVMCVPWSLAGFPDLTVPGPRGSGGMPLGLQLVGRPGQDEELLDLAEAAESVLTKAQAAN